MGFYSKALKRLDVMDIALIKLSVIGFVLWLITIWPAAMDWVNSVNPWYFLIVGIIVGARPFYRTYLKR